MGGVLSVKRRKDEGGRTLTTRGLGGKSVAKAEKNSERASKDHKDRQEKPERC